MAPCIWPPGWGTAATSSRESVWDCLLTGPPGPFDSTPHLPPCQSGEEWPGAQRTEMTVSHIIVCCPQVHAVVVVQLLSCVWLFAIPWTTACQASLSFTISRSFLRLMPIESRMQSRSLLSPSFAFNLYQIRVFCDESALRRSSVQFSRPVFATPWTAAGQASLSITNPLS